MATRITESELFLPALYVIYSSNKANTSAIIKALTEAFRPTGEDAAILAGRRDSKFSQIVRNLMGSHYDTNGMQQMTVKDSGSYFHLTAKGKKTVEDNYASLHYIFEYSFDYDQLTEYSDKVFAAHAHKKKLLVYDENDTVTEGKTSSKQTIVKERSKKLREAAIAHYTVDDTIKCCVCGFDFGEVYGDRGKGYIQIHHQKPIYQYAEDGVETIISDAIKDMKPVCANCHCMIHRNKDHMLTIEELKALMNV